MKGSHPDTDVFQHFFLDHAQMAKEEKNKFRTQSYPVFDKIPRVSGSKFGQRTDLSPDLRRTRSMGDLSPNIEDKPNPKRTSSMGDMDMVDNDNPFFRPKKVDETTRQGLENARTLAPGWKSTKSDADHHKEMAKQNAYSAEQSARE
jgi:hypothetical protein